MDQKILPSYRQIFEEIGKQLKLRKGTLLKRSLLISWPFLVLVVVGVTSNELFDKSLLSSQQVFYAFVFFIVYLVLALMYVVVVRFIFQIEKQIWIDSFFDNHHLEPSQSWKIAKSIIMPAFKFRLSIWARYIALPFISLIVLLSTWIYLFYKVFSTFFTNVPFGDGGDPSPSGEVKIKETHGKMVA